MHRILEFKENNKHILFILIFLVLTLLSLTQLFFIKDSFLSFLYVPFLVDFFGISAFIFILWLISLSILFFYSPLTFKNKKNILIAFIAPIILIIELSSFSTFFSYNKEGIFKFSYGGVLGEYIIKFPSEWDRFNPSLANYILGALRLVSLARGYDPRDFMLFAFGGAGPLHAVSLASELGIPKVLVPMRPGITNAVGCVVADVRHDYVNSINVPLAKVDMDHVHGIFASQIKAGKKIIASEGIDIEEMVIIHQVDMQFQGQTHILNFTLQNPNVSRNALQSSFEKAYLKRFNVELPEIRAVLVNIHTSVIGRRKPVPLKRLISQLNHKKKLSECIIHNRPVWFDSGWHDTPIYNREFLPPKIKFKGPAVIEQLDTTTVVEPGNHVEVDESGNLIISL